MSIVLCKKNAPASVRALGYIFLLNLSLFSIFEYVAQIAGFVKGAVIGEIKGDAKREHRGGKGDDDYHHLILDGYTGERATEQLTDHRARERHKAHHCHIGDTRSKSLLHRLAHKGGDGFEM